MPAASIELRDTVLQRQRDGATITQIAQELGVSRPTIYKSLAIVDNWEAYLKDKSTNIKRLAYDAVERGLMRRDAKASQLGLDWLKLTDLAPSTGSSYHVHGDVSLTQAIGYVPSPSGTLSTPSPLSTPSQPGTAVSTGTEAAAKPTGNDISVSNHENFLETVSDEQLAAELERRRLARMQTAQLVENVSK
jgi:AcrR family transcriptional regulator